MSVAQVANYEQVWVDGLNAGNVSVADDVFAPDCVIHITGFPEPIRGVDAWKQVIAGFLAAFPDMQLTIDEQVADGDRVATRWHAEGTHNGPFGPVPPTGRRVKFDGLILDHVSNNRVTERWEQFDQALILQQLGVA